MTRTIRPKSPSTMSLPSSAAGGTEFQADEAFALRMNATDPLREFRNQFHIPKRPGGDEVIYFTGNSLGLQPKNARQIVEQELDDWAHLAVDAHFKGKTPWYSYHEVFKESGARLVGGLPGEVVMMNSLTINLHLMMVSFYRPTTERYKILIEEPCFPSDMYAVKSHLQSRGIDPKKALVIAKPQAGKGEQTIRTEAVESLLEREGKTIALVLLGGVNFLTGQAFDIQRITATAHQQGCTVGWDLAHAAGNLALRLHDWNVDFAVWCSYKYLNAGPGSVAGCFVHGRYGKNVQNDLPRYAGWWGNDPETRFKMHLIPEFVPREGADGWQVSNPPILSMAPLKASLDLFDAAGMSALRAKSLKLTGYLRFLLENSAASGVEVITPREDESHGCQLSILVKDQPRERFKALEAAGVVCDFREPNVIRVAPTPLYNTFHEVWRFAQAFNQTA